MRPVLLSVIERNARYVPFLRRASRGGGMASIAVASAIVVVLGACVGGCEGRHDPIGPDTTAHKIPTFARALWRVPRAPSFLTGPAADDSSAYFASANHEVYAVRKSDGTLRWVSASIGTNFPVGRSLIVAKGLVLYPEFFLYAFDVRTGALAWVYRDSTKSAGGYFAVTADSSQVYGGSTAGIVVAINIQSGMAAWRTKVSSDTGQVNVYSPVLAGGRVFVGYHKFASPFDGGIVALDAVTGAVLWRRDILPITPDLWGGAYDGLVVWQDLVIVSAWDGRVHAFKSDSGTDVWTSPRLSALQSGSNDIRPLAASGNVIVVGSTLSMIQGLDARTGAVMWSQPTTFTGSADSPVVAMGDTVLFHYTSLQLGALAATTGATIWQTALNEPHVFGPPTFDATRVFVGADSGFYALRR